MRKSTNIAVSGVLALAVLAGGASSAAAQTVTTTTVSDGTQLRYVANLMNSINTLTIGSTGKAVIELQGILSELGFLQVPRGVALGYFGPLTRSALMTYQATRGVTATGMFDAGTKLALQNHLMAKGWMNSSGVIAMGDSSSSNTSSSGSKSSTNTSNTVSTNSTARAPLGLTGYWFDGNWYNSLPWIGTTTVSSNITEYWYNGSRYSISQIPDPRNPDETTVAINNTSTGRGYWFNGVWTAIDPDDIRGGYYSPNPGFAVGGANFQQGGNGYFQTFTYTPTITK